MKRLLAIFACLLFVGQMFAVQFSPNCTARTVQACTCCCGGHMKCCSARAESKPPAIPARTIAQNQLLMLAAVSTLLSPLPIEPRQQIFSSANLQSSPDAVPLFQRNCTILI